MTYAKQVALLIDSLPIVFKDNRLAMKGGTALNLFHHDMPRLSVDIDLVYLPTEDRTIALANMHGILSEMQSNLKRSLGCTVHASKPLDGKSEAKLVVERAGFQIKVEPNYTIRGTLFPPLRLGLSNRCSQSFGRQASVLCMDAADLYGGKICAALDRQHPRDLFDIKIFFERSGFDRNMIDAFLFYLISHNRPFHEVLAPNKKDIAKTFETDFSGMTEEKVEIQDLEKARDELFSRIVTELNTKDKQLLLSILSGQADWDLYQHPKIRDYPSIKWKLANIQKIDDAKRMAQLKALELVLG